jgi:nucleotide-binding universal stress UspA family protein
VKVFRRVLVGFDGSRHARQALRAAISLAAAAGGEVGVVIVVSASHGETDEDRQRAFEAEAAPLGAAAEAELSASHRPDTAITVHLAPGDRPAQALSNNAEERGFDLLVVGRHGRDVATHPGLGRAARELAEKTGCPLLLVGDGNPGGE